MKIDLCIEAAILGFCIIIAANFIDIKVTVNVTDKPIISNGENVINLNKKNKGNHE